MNTNSHQLADTCKQSQSGDCKFEFYTTPAQFQDVPYYFLKSNSHELADTCKESQSGDGKSEFHTAPTKNCAHGFHFYVDVCV